MKLPLLAVLACCSSLTWAQSSTPDAPADGSSQVAVTITGGHDTEESDRGRPVILIASALNVPPEVFRNVFKGVKPAGPGQQPEEGQVRQNKQVLMEGLSPYGVTDERLNEVSNYYRYRRDSGELWRHTDAKAYAVVVNGAVTQVVVADPGSGYSSPPVVTIPGYEKTKPTATLTFSTNFDKNGSIKEITVNNSPASP